MEFAVAKALKPSLRSEFVFQQTLGEELFSFNANTVVAGEDFSVDDLLDFSNGDDVIHHENDDDEEE
ncbi:GATA transcription factor 5-like, partial [Trifolium medium]|nr:GATA transcription factor 5-like [Trifolium medium]